MNWRNQRFDIAKVVGIGLLVYHFTSTPPAWQIQGVLLYLGILVGNSASWVFILEPFFKWVTNKLGLRRLLGMSDTGHSSSLEDADPPISRTVRWLCNDPRQTLKVLLLLPGEDGLFFVPLWTIGINPITALICAGLYAFAHTGQYHLRHVIIKMTGLFLVALFVLPRGLLNVIIGHAIVDGVGLVAFRIVDKRG